METEQKRLEALVDAALRGSESQLSSVKPEDSNL